MPFEVLEWPEGERSTGDLVPEFFGDAAVFCSEPSLEARGKSICCEPAWDPGYDLTEPSLEAAF